MVKELKLEMLASTFLLVSFSWSLLLVYTINTKNGRKMAEVQRGPESQEASRDEPTRVLKG